MAKGTLRDWAEPSYNATTGRPASQLEAGGAGGKGGTAQGQTQIGATKGVSAMDKSGSADPGRRKWGGSTP